MAEGRVMDSVVLKQLLAETNALLTIASELVKEMNDLYATSQKLKAHVTDILVLQLEQEKDA